MTGGESPVPGAGEDLMGLLKTMRREELLQVLSGDFCQHCQDLLTKRVREVKLSGNSTEEDSGEVQSPHPDTENYSSESSYGSSHKRESGVWGSGKTPDSLYSTRWKGHSANSTPFSVNSKPKPHSLRNLGSEINGVQIGSSPVVGNRLPEEQNEQIRVSQVGRKKDFVHIERINGKPINVLQGLELHTKVFNAEEQKKIVESVYNLQRMGQKGQLRDRTYSEPRKWMRGKGRITLQFGCCYNYAVDKNGNPPGIIREEDVDPLPPMFKQMIKRMVRWQVLPPTCVPNSCIVNIYDEGDCIPPHIDHHDFLRPFCTVSFLAECNILFGANLKTVGPGEFSGPISIPLPVGSVLILNGNGADVAKHCVPGVPAKRISITFRRMDESKIPYNYSPDTELVGLKPLIHSPSARSPIQHNQQHRNARLASDDDSRSVKSPFVAEKDEFPPLGGAVPRGPKR